MLEADLSAITVAWEVVRLAAMVGTSVSVGVTTSLGVGASVGLGLAVGLGATVCVGAARVLTTGMLVLVAETGRVGVLLAKLQADKIEANKRIGRKADPNRRSNFGFINMGFPQ